MKLRKWKGLFFVGLAAFTVGLLGAGCTTEPDSSGGGGGPPPPPPNVFFFGAPRRW